MEKINKEVLYKYGFVIDGEFDSPYGEEIYNLNPYVSVVYDGLTKQYFLHIDDRDMDSICNCLIETVDDLEWLLARYNPER